MRADPIEVHFNGSNGLGGIDMEPYISREDANKRVQPQSAIEIIHKLVVEVSRMRCRTRHFDFLMNAFRFGSSHQRPHEVSMICIGPLTNLALALKTYADIRGNIKEVYVMGGNSKGELNLQYLLVKQIKSTENCVFFSVAGVGNVSSSAEYNFYADPEAAHIALESSKCPITIVPWEACLGESVTISMVSEKIGFLH